MNRISIIVLHPELTSRPSVARPTIDVSLSSNTINDNPSSLVRCTRTHGLLLYKFLTNFCSFGTANLRSGKDNIIVHQAHFTLAVRGSTSIRSISAPTPAISPASRHYEIPGTHACGSCSEQNKGCLRHNFYRRNSSSRDNSADWLITANVENIVLCRECPQPTDQQWRHSRCQR